MRVVFCIFNFVEAKLRLQPWLTVHRVAQGLVRRGHAISLLTDVSNPASVDGIDIQSVASLRGSNSAEVRSRLEKLRPDALVYLPTPLNIVTASWLDGIACRRVGSPHPTPFILRVKLRWRCAAFPGWKPNSICGTCWCPGHCGCMPCIAGWMRSLPSRRAPAKGWAACSLTDHRAAAFLRGSTCLTGHILQVNAVGAGISSSCSTWVPRAGYAGSIWC